jgi:hypothetical protein
LNAFSIGFAAIDRTGQNGHQYARRSSFLCRLLSPSSPLPIVLELELVLVIDFLSLEGSRVVQRIALFLDFTGAFGFRALKIENEDEFEFEDD